MFVIISRLTIAKFGGCVLQDGNSSTIIEIVERIKQLKSDGKVLAVFSAPYAEWVNSRKSMTDLVLEYGDRAKDGETISLNKIEQIYYNVLDLIPDDKDKIACRRIIDSCLSNVQSALNDAKNSGQFTGRIRSEALAYAGEILMSNIMNFVLTSSGIKNDCIRYPEWPIITDSNPETNFLLQKSLNRVEPTRKLLNNNDVVCMGGFIGKTEDGVMSTFERGGSDRTAVDLALLLKNDYDVVVDFEKSTIVRVVDPKITKNPKKILHCSFDNARFASMCGMKILDPIMVKDLLSNRFYPKIHVTNINNPNEITKIEKDVPESERLPIKLITGKNDCCLIKMQRKKWIELLQELQNLDYSEFITLSPTIQNDQEFSRILFLNDEFVRSHNTLFRKFDYDVSISYCVTIITLVGDNMNSVKFLLSSVCQTISDIGINILNLDAQGDTSRIFILLNSDEIPNLSIVLRKIYDEMILAKLA